MNIMNVKFKLVSSLAVLPEYQTSGSSGFDLSAALENEVILKPLERKLIPTKIMMELPEGYEAQIRPRSGLALKHGITVLNSPGTIDSDYRGEIGVILINFSNIDFTIIPKMRIAQMIIAEFKQVNIVEVTETNNNTVRGSFGFGSTGL